MTWLKEHFQQFVLPGLSGFSSFTSYTDESTVHQFRRGELKLPLSYTPFFTPQELSVIKNQWRSVKKAAAGRPILLAGRDVFIYEILARREGFPTVFRPDISRNTMHHVVEDYREHFLVDTGFAGHIPKALSIKNYMMASSDEVKTQGASYGTYYCTCRMCRRSKLRGITPLTKETYQIFPRMKGSRSLALKIERTPKYWKRSYYRDGRSHGGHPSYPQGPTGIFQELSPTSEFIAAARLTIEVYTSNAPKFSPVVTITRPEGMYLD